MPRLRHRSHEEPPSMHERWLISYSDFITLLFAFFVVMYSVSQIDKDKYQALNETLNNAFTSNNTLSTREQTAPSSVASENSGMAALAIQLAETLAALPIASDLQFSESENWLELSLASEVLFASGRAQPSAEAKVVFDEIGTLLRESNHAIQIAGHTDNVPIANERFRDNWSLSAARALAVIELFRAADLAPERLSAAAFGEYKPVADNSTESGRKKNRRVVVRISGEPSSPRPEDLKTFVPVSTAISTSTALEKKTIVEPERADDAESQNTRDRIEPVRLPNGDLLFSSDPDLPRQ